MEKSIGFNFLTLFYVLIYVFVHLHDRVRSNLGKGEFEGNEMKFHSGGEL